MARVYFADQAALNRLAGPLGLDVWEVRRKEGYLVALLRPEQYTGLEQAGYRVEIDDAKTALLNQPLRFLPGQTSGIPGYPCYRTVEETYSTAQALASAHPALAAWLDIGDSWEKTTNPANGYDLRVLRLTNSAIPGLKPKLFAMSSIHAREYAPAELNTRFAEYLVNNYGIDPDVTWLLDYQQVHLMLQSNPDGRKRAETGLLWRKNTNNNYCANTYSRGADLNRNFEFQWGCCGGSSGSSCDETYRGPSSASEPETQAIQNYVRSQFPDQRADDLGAVAPVTATGVFMDLHSYSELVLWPWGFTATAPPNGTALQTLGRKFAYFNNYIPEQADTLYATDGTTDDFAYGTLGLAAFAFEMGTAFFQDCYTFENTILPDNLPTLLYAAKATRRPYQTPAGPDSLQVTVTQASVIAGDPVTLTAVADDTRYSNNGGTEPVQNIATARYTVDAPAWITGVISYSMSPVDGVFDASVETVRAVVDTTGWRPGKHLLLVESQDAAGNWGVPSAVFLNIASGSLTVTPAIDLQLGDPGTQVTHTLRVTNTGIASDTFDVRVGGNAWTTTAASFLGPLAAGSGADLNVIVSIPATATVGAMDTALVTVTSRGDISKSSTSALTTMANAVHGLMLEPSAMTQSGLPGATVTYTLRHTNTGNATDIFTLAYAGNTWQVQLPVTSTMIATGVGIDVMALVMIPLTITSRISDTVLVTAAGTVGTGVLRASVLTTTVVLPYVYLPLVMIYP